MNKTELLQDLASKTWCDSINGTPELKETKADGGKWYLVNIREVNPDGVSAVYRNIHFYVIDEGKKTEAAYYKDAIPTTITKKPYTFTEQINNFIKNSSSKFDVEKINEDREIALVKRYTENETSITEERFFVFMKDGKLSYKKIG